MMRGTCWLLVETLSLCFTDHYHTHAPKVLLYKYVYGQMKEAGNSGGLFKVGSAQRSLISHPLCALLSCPRHWTRHSGDSIPFISDESKLDSTTAELQKGAADGGRGPHSTIDQMDGGWRLLTGRSVTSDPEIHIDSSDFTWYLVAEGKEIGLFCLTHMLQ